VSGRHTRGLVRRGGCARGQALVEFALCASIFLLLTFAVMQFAILGHIRLVLGHASREGVRYASARLTTTPGAPPPVTDSQVKQWIIQCAGTLRPPLTEANIEVYPPEGQPRMSDTRIRVTITYDVRPSVPLIAPLLPPQMTLRAESEARME
jgi:hypothetical protein